MTSGNIKWLEVMVWVSTMLHVINSGFVVEGGQRPNHNTSNCTMSFDKNNTILNCNDRGLVSVPTGIPTNATALYMRSNFISVIPAGAFITLKHLTEIDLSGNKVFLSFHQDSLMGLQSLKNLILTKTTGVSFGCHNGSSRFFRPTPLLETLQMKKTMQFDTNCVNATFRDLPSLRYLSITWPTSPLPGGFSLLKRLDVLDLSSSTLNLTESTFETLSHLNITRLAMRFLKITGFNNNVIKPFLHSLQVLDFTCNNEFDRIGVKTKYFSPILGSLENATRLKILIIDKCYDSDETITLNADQFSPLKHIPLKALSLRQNVITSVGPFLRHLKHLEYINLDYNMPMIVKGNPFRLFADVYSRRHLKEFHLSHQYLHARTINVCFEDESEIFWRDFPDKPVHTLTSKALESKTQTSVKSFTRQQMYTKPNFGRPGTNTFKTETEKRKMQPSAKIATDGAEIKGSIPLEKLFMVQVDFSFSSLFNNGKSKMYDLNISDFTWNDKRVLLKNFIQVLDISSNFLTYINVVVYGLESLKIFNISNNNLEYVNPKLFRAMGELEHLYASINRIGLITRTRDFLTLFSSLPNIKTIDLSSNQLNSLPEDSFSECPQLVYLNLQRNGMKSVHLKFASLRFLKLLDFSYNEIKGFTKEQTNDLANATLTLQMISNSGFECSCANVPFIEWIQRDTSDHVVFNKSNLICQFEDGRKSALIDVNLGKLNLQCAKVTIIIVTATVTTILMCSILVIWRFKWHLKYWIYILRMKRRRDCFVEEPGRFDAYICYADMDYEVASSMCRKLEEYGLQVFFRERDTMLGVSVFDEFFRGIDSSRKCILCLTDDYLDSNERYFELQMSILRGKGFVIPVVVGDLALEKLSKPLRLLLRDGIYFEWPTKDLEAEDFWKSLIKAVLTPKGVCIRKNGAVMYYAD